ncbi:flagellar brake protein [Paenibacillus daejeonensis]|uniref:flagellar brake protein n=1 Tax=Paenibacillus daejeonensis TaxID=135193 RepID=UPI00035C3562|nr:flagellar brake domain-containing protein [Paenibacillus daejeonensis]
MLPSVNQVLYLQVASPDETEAQIEYKSRIADSGDGNLLIEIPLNESTGRYKKLYLGDELSAFFVAEGGVKHYFNSHVIGFKEDVVRLVAIHKPDPEQITKIQRRSFLRVAAELELAVRLTEGIKFVALTDDVGGGGISFVCDGKWKLKFGDVLDCWLLIPYKNGSLEHANFKSEVVRVKQFESGRSQLMCKFSEISDGERQKIIRFCFERQLDLRKR